MVSCLRSALDSSVIYTITISGDNLGDNSVVTLGDGGASNGGPPLFCYAKHTAFIRNVCFVSVAGVAWRKLHKIRIHAKHVSDV